MKIANFNISLQSEHSQKQQHSAMESLRVRTGNDISIQHQRIYFDENNEKSAEKVSLSEQAKNLLQNEQLNKKENTQNAQNAQNANDAQNKLFRKSIQKNNASKDVDDKKETDPKLLLIKAMIEAITGKSIKLAGENIAKNSNETPNAMANIASANGGEVIEANATPAFGLRYTYSETYSEQETTNFSATGIINTADGKQIEFQCDLSMQRSYSESVFSDTIIGASTDNARLCDPLVINFAGNAAELRNTTFSFDLDADGKAENIHELNSGSGFLVLDKNGDGKVNDGNEMFGTKTGDGFADLAAYDEDGNGWIDENDSIYNSLGVWNNNAWNGKIRSLQEAGIGAIYLKNANTEFSVKDLETNELQGQIRKTGIFLSEKGNTISVGTIQHIDLAI